MDYLADCNDRIFIFLHTEISRPTETPNKYAEEDLKSVLELIQKISAHHAEVRVCIIVPEDLSVWRDITPEDQVLFLDAISQAGKSDQVEVLRTEACPSWFIDSFKRTIRVSDALEDRVGILGYTNAECFLRSRMLNKALQELSQKESELMSRDNDQEFPYPLFCKDLLDEDQFRRKRDFQFPWEKKNKKRGHSKKCKKSRR
ncbi:hypothetical protein CSR02_15715 [Acetobacter pomorum]|uniref:Uncharacterized protein n=1 Tax=Acetobacter pomorum TaxID=65959 RepID=A0A2G4R7X6_9PROT|nr:hypothetical protein [Acetobacter pomorum]PHY92649.1 hypothetical protein CSR02_15715 [Acetobacter pomorum]GBR47681.1 hypothetical protein AA11825_0747 [Acetobacter pomorum DSM 11825]